jgi:hypothetical protein
MGRASYLQASFLGGEYSQAAQGRIDLPTYRTALNVCLNAIPIESGAWQRRGGTQHCGLTRGGCGEADRVRFRAAVPVPDRGLGGFFRYWSETESCHHQRRQDHLGDLRRNPAVITTTAAHGWSTGRQVRVNSNVKTLLRRDLAITVLSATTFSIADAVTGTAIDGATLDAFTSGTVARIAETASPYTGDLWRTVRSIQAETTAMMVNGTQPPYVLTVTQQPSDAAFAEFDLAQAIFFDGPYLDPIPGSWATASALSGNVTITLSFQTYDARRCLQPRRLRDLSGQGYKSILYPNENFQPNTAPRQVAAGQCRRSDQ